MQEAGNVFAADVIDRGPWLFYDRQTAAAGAATSAVYNFFATAIGGSKTKSDTNLLQANRLPPPQAFALQSIGFYLSPAMVLADIVTLFKNYYFEFKIGQKVFAEGPLQCFPGGAGVSGFASTNHATTGMLQAAGNGMASVQATRRFPDYPRIIPANVYFGLNVIGTSFTLNAAVAAIAGIGAPAYGGLDLLALLDGVYDREVQ